MKLSDEFENGEKFILPASLEEDTFLTSATLTFLKSCMAVATIGQHERRHPKKIERKKFKKLESKNPRIIHKIS